MVYFEKLTSDLISLNNKNNYLVFAGTVDLIQQYNGIFSPLLTDNNCFFEI